MSVKTSKARAIADVETGTLLAVVEIAAPPERIFRALTSREIVEWWGAEGLYRTTEWKGDVRVGGRWRTDGVGADGAPFSVEGEYLEIDPPRTLVHTWQPTWAPGPPTTVRYSLEATADGTRLTLRHHGFTSPDLCRGHSNGWMRVLDWLGAFTGLRPPGASAYFLVRLVPPRPTFMQTMTTRERDVMQEHVGYWAKLLSDGIAVAFGPVADPKGGWGAGIVELENPGAIDALLANDPAKRSEIGFQYEILPMVRAIVRPL